MYYQREENSFMDPWDEDEWGGNGYYRTAIHLNSIMLHTLTVIFIIMAFIEDIVTI
jgi:hypothetical protein